MTKAKKPEHARELSELREMYAESEKRRAAMEQRLSVLEKAEADRKQAAKEREERERRLNDSKVKVGGSGGYANPSDRFATEVDYKDALLKAEVGGIPVDNIFGIGTGNYLEDYNFGVTAKAVYLVGDWTTMHPEEVRHFADVLLPYVKTKKVATLLLTENRSELFGLVVFVNRRKEKNANGKMEDPVQIALDAGLLVMQSDGKKKLTPITDAKQVVTRQRKN